MTANCLGFLYRDLTNNTLMTNMVLRIQKIQSCAYSSSSGMQLNWMKHQKVQVSTKQHLLNQKKAIGPGTTLNSSSQQTLKSQNQMLLGMNFIIQHLVGPCQILSHMLIVEIKLVFLLWFDTLVKMCRNICIYFEISIK